MRRKIPNTAALMAFESAARHESFTKAGDDLALSQSAICRQIAGLEEFLGVPLFRRTRRGVKLTEAGEIYSRQVSARLDAVEHDTLALMAHRGQGSVLELAVVPTFATRWLMPRLAGFQRAHPGVTVNLSTSTRPFLFDGTAFDAAIYFGDAGWPGTEAHFLMHEQSVPVCSPALLERALKTQARENAADANKHGAKLGPKDNGKGKAKAGDRQDNTGTTLEAAQLARLPLLQQGTRPYAWRHWFESRGMRVDHDLGGPRYELFSMLAQAAMHDMGVALIPPMLIEEELAGGRLAIVIDHASVSEKAYYLIFPERKSGSAGLAAFSDWLRQEAGQYRAGSRREPEES
jgi:DNA-binding transcriptional LysR family regulator